MITELKTGRPPRPGNDQLTQEVDVVIGEQRPAAPPVPGPLLVVAVLKPGYD